MSRLSTNLRQLVNGKALIILAVGVLFAELSIGVAPRFSMLLMAVTSVGFAYMVRTQSHREFQKRELVYRTAIEGTHLGMWEWDVVERRGTSHRNWGDRLGYDETEGPDSNWDALVHPEDLNDLLLAIERHADGETPFANAEFRMKGADGEWFWVMGTGQAVDRDDDGRPRKLVGVHMDISETKQAQFEAVRKREQLAAFVEYAPAAVAMFDVEMRYLACTRQWLPVVGVRDEDVAGRSYFEVSPSSSNQWRDVHRSCLSGNIERCDEDRMVRADGSVMRVRWEARPWNREDGTIGGVCVFFEDISETRALIDELAATRDRALNAAKAKSQFLASMSHEIRTPMNAILGMAELLGESDLEKEQREYLRQLANAGEHLLDLINEILDLSKIEAGQLKLERTRFNLEELVDSIGELMSVKSAAKGIDLLCQVDPDVRVDRIGDPVRLKQILINLIGNAIKFTEVGEVDVRVRRDPDVADDEHIVISVRDTGIGVDSAKMNSIFESFTQADASTTRKYGGTGLGLSISKRLAKMMAGCISVESELGKGSTFNVALKLEPAANQQTPASDISLSGKHILVLDPSTAGRRMLSEHIRRWGGAVTELASAEEAAAAGASGKADAALIAVDRRGEDRFSLVRAARQGGMNEDTPVLMLTKDGKKGDEAESKDLHIVRSLRKPIARRSLADALDEALGRIGEERRVRVVENAPAQAEIRPARILVAEDQKVNQVLLKAFLKNSPHELTLAENGQVAVELYKEHSFDIVFLDVQMPVMDGYTAAATIREFERENGMDPRPLVALTANAMRADIQRSLAAGCNEHLSKPIKKSTLLATIEKYSQPPEMPLQQAS